VSPDVVHTHLTYADISGLPAARRLGIPAVSTVHLSSWTTALGRDLIRAELAALVRRTCSASTILVSDHARDAYASRFRGRAGALVSVPNGVVDDRQSGAGRAVRGELGLHPDDVVVLMLGVLRDARGMSWPSTR
jgi:glycosyltransferase involved in cell wall biosynthesis